MSTLTAPAPTRLSPKLQQIRTQIHALSQQERQVLLQALLAEESQTNGASAEAPAEPVRFVVPVEPRSLESLGLPKGKPFTKLEDYAFPGWPEEEKEEDIYEFFQTLRAEALQIEAPREEIAE